MSRASRLAAASGYAGLVLGMTTAGLAALLRREATVARARVQVRQGQDPPDGTGWWGDGAGAPLTLALLGDSSAVGRGVDEVGQTPGVLLAVALSELADRPVRLVQVAVTGSESRHLGLQVGRALPERPDIAVIMIGTNDVTARNPRDVAVGHLRRTVAAFREVGVPVVVGTCPDLGTLRPVAQPLRRLGRHWSRQLAAAQTVGVVDAGGRTVSLGSILGPEFAVQPDLFSADAFHPSAAGYARAAAVMLPSIADALELPAPGDVHVLPVESGVLRRAAARAAGRPGTEVSAREEVTGRSPARSLRRRPALMPTRRQVDEADRGEPAEHPVGEPAAPEATP